MELTMLPSKKTRAEWSEGLLMIAQGNCVIELTPDQAHELVDFVKTTSGHSTALDGEKRDMGN